MDHVWPFSSRKQFLSLARTLAVFVGIQLIVQLIGFLCGILVVRMLSKADYAIFTIAGSALGLLTNLSDLGVGNAMLALGGRVWQDNVQMGQLVYTAQKVRWVLFVLGSLVATSVFLSFGLRAGASTGYALVICGVLLLSAISQLNYTIWSVVPRLHAEITRLQRLDLASALIRLSLLAASALTLINSAIVLVINSVGLAIQAFVARRWANRFLAPDTQATREDRRKIMDLVRSQMPNALFYCVYGQATVLVISIFGRTKEIAEVGALSRLGALLAILGSVMSMIVLPRFARAQTSGDLARKYHQVVFLYLFGSGTLWALTIVFPEKLLWVLGDQYASLEKHVGWVVLSALAHTFVGLLWSLNTAKGWVKRAWTAIPAIIVLQAITACIVDLATVKGAIIFGALPILGAVPAYLMLAEIGIRQAPNTGDMISASARGAR